MSDHEHHVRSFVELNNTHSHCYFYSLSWTIHCLRSSSPYDGMLWLIRVWRAEGHAPFQQVMVSQVFKRNKLLWCISWYMGIMFPLLPLLWVHTLSLGLLEEAPVDVTVVVVRVLDSGNAVEEYSPDCMMSCFDVGRMFHNGIPVVLRPLLHPCTCKLPLPTQTGGHLRLWCLASVLPLRARLLDNFLESFIHAFVLS